MTASTGGSAAPEPRRPSVVPADAAFSDAQGYPLLPPEPRRLTPTERLALADERLHEVTMATLRREPSAPESTVEIGTTAKHSSKDDPTPKRLHTWSITVRGVDAQECDRLARRLDDGLAARYAHELDNGDDLAGKLAQSIAAQDKGGKP